MLKSLPPAGNPVLLSSSVAPEKVFQRTFGDRSVFLYGSGTMALAAALMAARDVAWERHNVDSPEVLLPAYACPDLVSAALYAGLKPVLVDLEDGTPWMDLDRLRHQVGPNTVAVIAAHFLGIPERLTAIRVALEGANALIVEDSAQLFPSIPCACLWEGDLVTLSFGRGKPVSLLGGGAVLCRNRALTKHLPLAKEAALKITNKRPGKLYKLKAHLYNSLLSPGAYGLLKYVPFLHLGETAYHPLEQIVPLAEERVGILAANIDLYQARKRKPQEWISKMLAGIGGDYLIDLTAIGVMLPDLPLLRYPVLLKDEQARDELLGALSRRGLGCSRMYPKPLKEIAGIEGCCQWQGSFPRARLFSQRLLTLPCHVGVGYRDVEQMKQVIEEVLCAPR